MALACKDEILLIFCIFGKKFTNKVCHRVVLDQLGFKDILISFIWFEVWVMHVASTDHRLEEVIMEV